MESQIKKYLIENAVEVFGQQIESSLIQFQKTRKDTIANIKNALHKMKISGIKNNIKFLNKILDSNELTKSLVIEPRRERNYPRVVKKRPQRYPIKKCQSVLN
mgnify:CR=1 FL=1